MNRFLAILPLSFTLVGCGPRETPTHPVAGKVVVDGKPAAGVQVAFVPLAKPSDIEANPTATTGKDGAFKLTTRAKDDGAPAGEYKVVLSWTVQDGPNEDPRIRKLLPDQYAAAGSTPLKATVQAGPNDVPVFDLKGRK
jgi:hypothetical protein